MYGRDGIVINLQDSPLEYVVGRVLTSAPRDVDHLTIRPGEQGRVWKKPLVLL